jgi:peptide/nickel transport system permease protein
MREGTARLAALVFAFLVVLAVASLFFGPYPANEQLDPSRGRYRPPLTTMQVVRLQSGVRRLVERAEIIPDGLWIEVQGEVEVLPLAEVTNLTGDGVRERRFFLMGSDKLGRDVFSRWLNGARISLMIATLVVGLATLIGVSVGAVAALGPRWLDSFLMRLVDGLLAFPWIFLLITLGTLFPASIHALVLLLGATTWMGISRIVRAEFLALMKREFILAARGLGADPRRIFFHHLLPNILPTLLVAAPLRIGSVILVESSLSFLGMGIQPPEPSWGNMIAEGREAIIYAWWVPVFPALALVVTMLSLNLMSDGMRDWLDPQR